MQFLEIIKSNLTFSASHRYFTHFLTKISLQHQKPE